jgi:hypothetical protein
MSERNPFEQQPKSPVTGQKSGSELRCEEWEALLADALDGLLPPHDGAAFEAHCIDCALCAQLLAQARQGQEWMQFLHAEPEMPADMMERILSRTSGAVADRPLAVHGAPIPIGPSGVLGLPRRHMVWDTRLMMTAAMAFFSIALTLNLAGIRLTNLRLADLTPASMQNNLTRQFYGAKGQVVRYYDNLRFVYEVESKLRELRRDDETQAPAVQPKQETPAPHGNDPQSNMPQQNNPPSGHPQSDGHKNGGKLEIAPSVPQPDVIFGQKMLASEAWTGNILAPEGNKSGGTDITEQKEVKTLVAFLRDQAGRSLA